MGAATSFPRRSIEPVEVLLVCDVWTGDKDDLLYEK
jgi:hypothetical protein